MNEKTTTIDDLIAEVLDEMKQEGVDSEEYPKLMTYLERLQRIKADKSPNSLSRDTIALIAGNLLGILLIVAYEQKHVMTSRALSQLIRLK